jgi:ribosomal protein S18 acetylase RimI-like enzyme
MNMRSSTLETVEILDLRHYTSADLRPLLDREAEIWAQRMDWDYRSSADMILRYIDSKILPGYTAIENGRVVGYSFFVYEGSKGVIGDLFVSAANGHPQSDLRHEDALRARLVTHVIETLQQTPGVHRVEAQLLVHPSGSVAEPFLREGFRAFPRLFMELPLANAKEACEAPLPPMPDIEIRNWMESDFQAAAQLITNAYLGHIDSEINDQYRTVGGSLRFLNNIVRFPGCGVFDPSSSLVAVSRITGGMAGLLLCSRVRDDVGHVTQVCLLPEHRGRSLGRALMMQCCRNLRKQRFSELTLTVTQANTPAVDLYKRMGFETRRVFDAFVWEG